MKKFFNKDKVMALCLLIFAVWYLLTALTLPASTLANDPGPAVFPAFGAVIVIICSILILLRKYDKKPEASYTKKQWGKVGIMLGMFVGYLILLAVLGFIIATPIALIVISYLFTDEGVKVAIWKRILFAVVVTGLIYLIFNQILNMLLPRGMFF